MKVDVAIVGAGPVGLAVAIHAARTGLSTLVLERRSLPVDKACGEGLLPGGVVELERLGARALIRPEDASTIEGIRYVQEDGTTVVGLLPPPGGLGIRRVALVSALAQRAREAGAILQTCRVESTTRGPEKVLLATTGGEVEATLLVAADGLASPLRRAANLDGPPAPDAPRRFGMRQHFRMRPWSSLVEVHYAPGVEAYVTPAGSERVGVAFLWEHGAGRQPLSFQALCRRFPSLVARLEGAQEDSTVRGAGPLARTVKGRVLDRLVLVGDAAGYVDAITGEGLTLGFRGAAILGDILPEVIARGATRASLEPYERRFLPEYRRYARLTRGLLAAARRPRLRAALIRWIARRPALFQAVMRWALR